MRSLELLNWDHTGAVWGIHLQNLWISSDEQTPQKTGTANPILSDHFRKLLPLLESQLEWYYHFFQRKMPECSTHNVFGGVTGLQTFLKGVWIRWVLIYHGSASQCDKAKRNNPQFSQIPIWGLSSSAVKRAVWRWVYHIIAKANVDFQRREWLKIIYSSGWWMP